MGTKFAYKHDSIYKMENSVKKKQQITNIYTTCSNTHMCQGRYMSKILKLFFSDSDYLLFSIVLK